MSKKFLVIFPFIASLCVAAHPIIVTIPEIITPKGDIKAVLFNSEESFNKKENFYGKKKISVTGSVMIFEFDNVEPGVYAVQLFQDLNDNGEMDKGMLGPKEPYGISTNPKKMGKPKYEDVSFESNTTTNIVIELKNQ